MASPSAGNSLNDVEARHPELWAWAGSLCWGPGRQIPCEPPRNVLEPLIRERGPRSSTGINSLKERWTQQWKRLVCFNPTVPIKGLIPSCRICKRRFPLSPEAEGRGRVHSELSRAGFPHGMFHYHWTYKTCDHTKWASQVVLGVKNAPANTGDIRGMSLIPGMGRSPGRGHGNPLQHSCLENPMDRGAWKATVHGVTQNGHGWSMEHTYCPKYHSWSVHYTEVGSLRACKYGRNQHKFAGHLFSIKRMQT